MIIKKIISGVFFLLFFNGCIQNSAFIGPAVTTAYNGNIYQAGASYGSSKAITKITKKTPFQNLEMLLKSKKNNSSLAKAIKIKVKKYNIIK